jgi:hypothetical protein
MDSVSKYYGKKFMRWKTDTILMHAAKDVMAKVLSPLTNVFMSGSS